MSCTAGISSLTDQSKNDTFPLAMTRGPEKRFDRTAVLETAMELFWANGYEGTGLTELTRRMGIGRQSLYDTFGDKHRLFREALAHYFETRVGPVISTLRSGNPPLENLRDCFALWEKLGEEGARTGHPCGCMVGNSLAELAGHDEQIAGILRRYLLALEDAMSENFRRGQESGEFADDVDARDLARTVITGIQGLALLSRVARDPGVLQSVKRVTMRMVKA